VCKGEGGCGKKTCTGCKTLVDGDGDSQTHVCEESEAEKQFKELAKKKRFQECPSCCSMVELRDACNHVT
jgi:hypothetical protein